MDDNDKKFKAEAESKVKELERTQSVLEGLGVKDNKWTTFKLDICKTLHQLLLETLQKRQDAWVREEARFQYAVRANAYKVWSKDVRNNVNDYNFGVTLEAVRSYKPKMDEEDKKFTGESEGKLTDIEKCQGVLDNLGVTDNKWTTLSLADNKDIHTELKDTLQKRQAAWKSEEARLYAEFCEALRIKYAAEAGDVNLFLERAKDTLDPNNVIVDSIDAVKVLQGKYAQFLKETIPTGKKEFDALEKLYNELRSHNISDFGGLPIDLMQKRWQEMMQLVDNYKQALADEMKRQEDNEKLRVSFAEKANTLNHFLKEHKKKVTTIAESGGTGQDLKSSLEKMKIANTDLKTNQDKLDTVLAEDKKMTEAHIIENKHTTLSTAQLKIEWEQLNTLTLSNIQLLEKEIRMQQMTGVSAELMAEFKELFSHFDAEKKRFP